MATDFNEPCACLPLRVMELLTHRMLILVGPCRLLLEWEEDGPIDFCFGHACRLTMMLPLRIDDWMDWVAHHAVRDWTLPDVEKMGAGEAAAAIPTSLPTAWCCCCRRSCLASLALLLQLAGEYGARAALSTTTSGRRGWSSCGLDGSGFATTLSTGWRTTISHPVYRRRCFPLAVRKKMSFLGAGLPNRMPPESMPPAAMAAGH
ncbi:hypothetical protein ACLOJK_022858 [Asimina triloba]